MKKIIAFLLKIWYFLFGRKVITEKVEEMPFPPMRSRRYVGHPPHNNRSSKRNKRGVRSRFTQYRPQDAVHGGKPIYHTVLKSPSI